MLGQIKKLLLKDPNLRAREIARKTGFDKTEISKYMRKHLDEFIQNDNYEWSLRKGLVKINFAGQWTDTSLFEKMISESCEKLDDADEVVFILPENCKFFIESIARLLALCNQLDDAGKNVTIDLNNNKNSLSYWNRVGFFDHLNKEINVLPGWPKSSTAKSRKGKNENVVEFGAIDPKSENRDLVKQLTNSFVIHQNKNEEYDNPIFTIFSEMIKNVKDHSQSLSNGFAALQKYDGYSGRKPHIQIVVSDSGIGIADSLRPHLKKHYPKLQKLSDIELVTKVLEGEQLSRHGSDVDSGHGLGFKESRNKALKFNAKYSVRQNNFSIEFQFKSGNLQPATKQINLVEILGTHICFDFDVDDSEAV